MIPNIPSLPQNRPYYRPLNYLEYVKDPNVYVKVFKVTIRVHGEIKDAKIINLFSFTLKNIVFE
jgi:hypothetical protein